MGTQGTKILVVEDEKDLRDLMCLHLRREGYSVDEAGDGDEALTKIKEHAYQVFVFDWMLPGLSGLDLTKKILDLIFEEADNCLSAIQGINLEHKIVMSIAIRLKAEQFMKLKITDKTLITGLDGEPNQTWALFKKYQEEFNNEKSNLEVLKKVNLITPENIHVNSFMYEPILDMGDNELRDLYRAVKTSLT
jgi:CheY-like chemotaxis protein